ncbi:hypothetical protein TYRP_021153 [Tyrophagus putrescentiae]|nr:hypothetical protein TYRP_021153 [Tyrophagus putrescentiae]
MNQNCAQKSAHWFTTPNQLTGLEESPKKLLLKIDKVLAKETVGSNNGEVIIFRNRIFGCCLTWDGDLQFTELDECSYQEMMAYLPLNSHPDPKRVLVIGGCEGGLIMRVANHPKVKQVEQVHFEMKVMKMARKYLPSIAAAHDAFVNGSKVTLVSTSSMFSFLTKRQQWDVIIVDSGCVMDDQAENYFKAIKKGLNPGGVVCTQAPPYSFNNDQDDQLKMFFEMVKPLFPSATYATTLMPSNTNGQAGILLAGKLLKKGFDFSKPVTVFSNGDCNRLQLKYYSAKAHQNAFVLPPFVKKIVS